MTKQLNRTRRSVAALVAALLSVGLLQAVVMPSARAADWVQPGHVTTILGGGWGLTGPATEALLPMPAPAATDPRNGDVVVAIDHTVARLAAGATTLTGLATLDLVPSGVAIGPDGTVYLSDSHGVYRLQGGALTRLAGNGNAVRGCSAGAATAVPVGGGVTVDRSDGTLYAYSSWCVWRIADATVSAISAPAGSSWWRDVAVDAGSVWAVDGTYLWQRGRAGWSALSGGTVGSPSGVAFGAGHRMYYTNADAMYVTPSPGAPATKVADTPCMVLGDVDVSGRGLLHCSVSPSGPVYLRRFGAGGNVVTVVGVDSVRPSPDGVLAQDAHLGTIDGLATNPADGSLWFSSQGRVRRIASDGRLATVSADPRLVTPGRIAFGTDGSAYVADRGAARVWVVAADGTTTPLTADTTFTAPRSVAVASDGAVLVADGAVVVRVAGGVSSVVAGGGATPGLGKPNQAPATGLALGTVRDIALAPDGRLGILADRTWEVTGATAHLLPGGPSSAVDSLAYWGAGSWIVQGRMIVHRGGQIDVVTALSAYDEPYGQLARDPGGVALSATHSPDEAGDRVRRYDDPAVAEGPAAPDPPGVVVRPGWVEVSPPQGAGSEFVVGISAQPPTTCGESAGDLARDPDTLGPLVPGKTYWATRCHNSSAYVSASTVYGTSSAVAATAFVAVADDEAPDPVGGITVFEGRDVVSLRIAERPRPPDWDRVEIRYWDQPGSPPTPGSGTRVDTPSPGLPTDLRGLTPGVSYGIAVFNLDRTGNYAPPITLRVQLDRTPPGPAGLAVTPSYQDARVTATLPTDPDLSSLVYSVVPGTVAPSTPPVETRWRQSILRPVPTYTFDVSGLTMDTVYTLAVWTVDHAGNISDQPSTATFRTLLDLEPPAAPSLSLGVLTDHKVTFTVTPATPRPDDYATSFSRIVAGNSVPAPDAPYLNPEVLRADTEYTAVAYSQDRQGNVSSPSTPVRFRTSADVTPPRAPRVSGWSPDTRRIHLLLEAATYPSVNFRDTTAFRVAVRPGTTVAAAPSPGDDEVAADPRWMAAHDVRVATNGQYTVTVWAVDEVGHVSPGASRTVTTTSRPTDLPLPVSGVTAQPQAGDRRLLVTWTPAASGAAATSYRLVAVDDAGRRGPILVVPAAMTSTTVIAPSVRPTYVEVTAVNLDGQSEPASSAPVTPRDAAPPPPMRGVRVTFTGSTAHLTWPAQPTMIERIRIVRTDDAATRPARVAQALPEERALEDAGLSAQRHTWTLTGIDYLGRESTPIRLTSSLLTTTLQAQPSAAYGARHRVSGRVTVQGAGSVAGRHVTVRTRTSTGWRVAARTVSGADGRWSVRLPMTGRVELRAHVESEGSAMGTQTAARTVRLGPGVVAELSSSSAPAGNRVRVVGRAKPIWSVGPLLLQTKRPGTRWHTEAHLTPSRTGRFRATLPTTRAGTLQVRVTGRDVRSRVLTLQVTSPSR